MMKIFLVTRNGEFDCDQYDAAVVAAESPVDSLS